MSIFNPPTSGGGLTPEQLDALATDEEVSQAVGPLATRASVEALEQAMAGLATDEEVSQAVAPLATRASVEALEQAVGALPVDSSKLFDITVSAENFPETMIRAEWWDPEYGEEVALHRLPDVDVAALQHLTILVRDAPDVPAPSSRPMLVLPAGFDGLLTVVNDTSRQVDVVSPGYAVAQLPEYPAPEDPADLYAGVGPARAIDLVYRDGLQGDLASRLQAVRTSSPLSLYRSAQLMYHDGPVSAGVLPEMLRLPLGYIVPHISAVEGDVSDRQLEVTATIEAFDGGATLKVRSVFKWVIPAGARMGYHVHVSGFPQGADGYDTGTVGRLTFTAAYVGGTPTTPVSGLRLEVGFAASAGAKFVAVLVP